jgi:hypothetical protein
MTTGKYFNRGVMALDSPYIGHVIRETEDKIVIFGERNDRYDILKSEIQMTSRNVLIGLKLDEIAKKYKVKHDDPLPTTVPSEHWTQGENLDLGSYERKYPKGLFNKGVRVLNEDHVGHVMKETDDKIVDCCCAASRVTLFLRSLNVTTYRFTRRIFSSSTLLDTLRTSKLAITIFNKMNRNRRFIIMIITMKTKLLYH